MIKLIACDLDDTLLNLQHELDKEDSAVIQQVQQMGIEFMIATGRSYGGASSLIKPFGIVCDYLLLNGALLKDKVGNTLQETPLPFTKMKEIIEIAQKENVCFHMYSYDETFTFDAKRGKREALAHLMHNGLNKAEAIKILTKGKFGVYDKEFHSNEEFYESKPIIHKVEMFLSQQQQQKRICKLLANISDIEVTNSVVDNIEITSYAAQKGFALATYCKNHGIKKDEILVFGDSLNDKNMISKFPNSFAVANATETILQSANYITDSNLNHGVTKVLRALIQANQENDFLKCFKNIKK